MRTLRYDDSFREFTPRNLTRAEASGLIGAVATERAALAAEAAARKEITLKRIDLYARRINHYSYCLEGILNGNGGNELFDRIHAAQLGKAPLPLRGADLNLEDESGSFKDMFVALSDDLALKIAQVDVNRFEAVLRDVPQKVADGIPFSSSSSRLENSLFRGTWPNSEQQNRIDNLQSIEDSLTPSGVNPNNIREMLLLDALTLNLRSTVIAHEDAKESLGSGT